MSFKMKKKKKKAKKNKEDKYENNTHSKKPGLCFVSTWSPNCIWHCIPANWAACSTVTGWVPLIIASLAWKDGEKGYKDEYSSSK